ncbi:MAG: acetyl-CoA C-acetyltransferase [Deltaproteobacteria bacterium]|nr:acetyl-CoA C-acetyltransferase [Deltaproteobacteria bacterium]
MLPVYIAGIGMSQFGKSSNTLVEIMEGAAARALAGSKIQDIEAIYIAVMNPEEFTGDANIASHVVEALGLTGIPALRVETASSAGAAALHAAFQSIASGYYRQVLVLGGEKMTHLSTSATTRILAEVIDAQERQCGATMPALAAMITEKYRRKHHISESRMARALCAVAMKNHAYGAHNPYAQFRQTLSKDKYLASKFVATPLRLYDCAPITDGAAAVILTAARTDILISGIGQGTGPVSLRERDSLSAFPATQIAARKAYQMAGIAPKQVDCAEVHDAFTPFEIIGTEDLGFFAPGKGGQAVVSGQTAADGILPVNLSGGLKSRGHPVGASGVAQIVEIARLLRGESAVKLKREPRRALAQSIGGLATNNFVTIVKKKAAAAIGAEGVIETFTVLHITPDGFLPPLALALIRDRKGALIMAQGEDITHLKIGREVYLRQVAGTYYFTVKSQLQKVRQAIRQLLGKKRSHTEPADGKKAANG